MFRNYATLKLLESEITITEQKIIDIIKRKSSYKMEVIDDIYDELEPMYNWEPFDRYDIYSTVIIPMILTLYIKLIQGVALYPNALDKTYHPEVGTTRGYLFEQIVRDIMLMQVRFTFDEGKVDLIKDIEAK